MVSKFPAGTRNRWVRITEALNMAMRHDEPRTKEECIWQFKTFSSSASSAGKGGRGGQAVKIKLQASSSSSSGNTNSKEEESTQSEGKGEEDINSTGGWSREQQQQLENALRAFPASNYENAKERWKAIAKVVEGKNMKECVARYKSIRNQLKKA